MARGWESKEVEMQIASALERQKRPSVLPLTAEEVAIMRQREGLELSRTRVMNDFNSATNPGYRQILLRSLEFLDQELARLHQRESDGS